MMDSKANQEPAACSDEHWMQIALSLAARGQGAVEPNPMVGCVLVKDQQLIGQGYHHAFGLDHAEVDALKSLASAAEAEGATAYVTLEPCCHHGKTPPCSEALIAAKVRRVVIALADPFPKVSGGGIEQLKQAGIDVTLGVLQQQAEALNAPYLKLVRTGMPWVIAKWAMTADGKIATVMGESQWITGQQSRHQVHLLRSRVDAIVVGMGTVAADDPLLTARINNQESQSVQPARVAQRIVLCHKRLPSSDAKLMQTATKIPTWLYCSPLVDSEQLRVLQEMGAQAVSLSTSDQSLMVRELLTKLGDAKLSNIMIEGGGELLGSFIHTQHCLIDECHVYVGATLFGGKQASGPIAGLGLPHLDQAPRFDLQSVDSFGQDVRMILRRI
ncbi:bifunctional diaminohydroxyphosphoribosylaminopyrimidine deaminase/5-amino-6-(5-phosphoribosylamino)uracil reductase RibD [Stieleria bergensis]